MQGLDVPGQPRATHAPARWAVLLTVCMLSLPVMGQPVRTIAWEELPDRPRLGNYVGEVGIDPAMFTENFLAAHPDLRWRRAALHEFSNGHYDRAMVRFLRAARHADKPSQAMIAEMYWDGLGVRRDRPLAYVWMDIAAERMYPNFVILRERYWHALSEDERSEAIERGQAVLAEFGDDVAKPRMERVLTRHRRRITGSRTGSVNALRVLELTGPLGGASRQTLDDRGVGNMGVGRSGAEVYADKYWVPEQYWALQDEVWRAPAHNPDVQIGELEQVKDGGKPEPDGD